MVQVQDVNERVTWATSSCLPGLAQAFAACLTVTENTVPGSAAAVLQSIAGMATDPDTLAKQALTFSVALDGNSFEGAKLFDVAPSTGVLSVKQDGLNHEQAAEWTLVVTATDNGTPQLSASTLVHVTVEDVNEAPSLAAVLRVLNGTAGDLNFESLEKSKYQLVVRATDGGGLTARATVTVDVTDVNEAPVLFDAVRSVRENTLAPGKVGAPVTGTDPDNAHPVLGVRQQLLYSIARDDVQPTPLTATATVTISLVDANDAPSIVVPPGGYVLQVEELAPVGTVLSGNSLGIFAIDAVTGQVSVADFGRMDFENKDMNAFSLVAQVCDSGAPALCAETPHLRGWARGSLVLTAAGAMGLNHEVVDSYTLVVSVTDAGGLSDTATVTVAVADLNERPILAAATFSINENSPRLSVVAGSASLATDEDADDSHTYEVVNQVPAGVFRVASARTGQLEVDEAVLDFEAGKNLFALTVSATDSKGNSASAAVTVRLSNVNEPPMLRENGTAIAAMENTVQDIRSIMDLVRDPDAGDAFRFEILSGDRCSSGAKVIKIDASTGVLSMVALGTCTQTYDPSTPQFKPNDVDFDNKFDLMIRITDSHLASTVNHLVIKLSNSNSRPRFVLRTEPFLLDENSAVGTLVGTVFAVDLNYQKQSLEYAVGPRGANVNRPFPFKMVTREATEQDRMAPGPVRRRRVGAAPPALAGDKLVATDVDSADQGSVLRYSLEGEQAAVDLFQVDPISGAMVFKGSPTALNFENVAARAFELTAVVTDSASNAVRRPVQVRVLDVNEPPRFVGTSAFFFNVLEGSKFGTLVGSCAAVDDDAPTSARGQLRFSIAATDGTPSDDSALFEISQAGKLTVKQESLDWENQAEYSFVVTVTDGDADSPLSASRPVLVIVRDVNDISVDSFAALPADVAGGVAWDVDVDPATAAVPNMYNGEVVDWRATHSTMDALSVTAGGARLVISGTNFGKTAARIAREKAASLDPASYPEDAFTRYEVTYGPVRGTKYAATNCSRFGGQSAPNTAIVCSTSEGAGVNHIWRVTVVYDDLSDVLPFSRTSSAKTGFAPPVVTSALIADASAAAFATQGGQRFVVRGQNFGPAFYARSSADGTGVESVPVTPIVRYGPVTGTENRAVDCAFVEGHTAIACNSVPGVGAGLKFVVSADGQSSEVFTSSLAYSPPTISRVSQLVLATQGGDEVTLFGDNFGPIGTAPIVAEYHHDLALAVLPDGFAPYRGVACQVAVDAPHRRITCRSSPGIGRNHSWRVLVGGQLSAVSGGAEGTSAYKPPVITKIGGLGADMADTKGGQQVLLSGANFGPVTQLDADGNVIAGLAPLAMYGRDGPSWPAYHARDCRVTVPHEQVVCITTEGTGRELVWELEIGAQRTARMLDMPTNYHPPVVSFYRGPGATDADTAGQEVVFIEGRNFGGLATVVQNATYGKGSAEFSAQDCSVVTAHTLIQCTTDVGAGEDLTWSITVDEQASVSPTTDYHPPEITGFAGPAAADASTNGGQEIVIQGNYFSVGKYLQSVTYGPTGSEFAAHGCHVSVPHKEIRCQTVPGTGRVLRWVVTVKGQASPLSSVSTSYARPVINATTPGNSATNGGVLVRVTGQDFGVKWPLSELSVLLNARAGMPLRPRP
ncbi:hypothetical protein FNF31_07094 [Cafeteria roenbergensis]|uniref:Cadherin domain-containing protein n=1 Tax=Cafeteria roenbergensis TaxID=33653 RepID=A0A5A8CAZ4_CAFRO|nr:hypothetical protein FNF31_07094 [Cafeteria roenbergensis]